MTPNSAETGLGYETEAEWLSAVGSRGHVQTHGPCDRETKHNAHTFTYQDFGTHISGWSCPGQYADCANCDDRKCMDCVCRIWHDDCRDDCPRCCPAPPTPADSADRTWKHGDIGRVQRCVPGGDPYWLTVVWRHDEGWCNPSGVPGPLAYQPEHSEVELLVRDGKPTSAPSLPVVAEAAKRALNDLRDFLDQYAGTAFPDQITAISDGYSTRYLLASDLRVLLNAHTPAETGDALTTSERLALDIAVQHLERDEVPTPYVTAVCLYALRRLAAPFSAAPPVEGKATT